jgi:chemotaxis protein MotB
MRRKKRKGYSGFNVWRSYSDMMAGLLLLFVLIMCVTLFQAQKNYDDSLKERDERIAMQEQVLSQQTTLDEQQGQLASQDELLASQRAKLDEQQAKLDELAEKLAAQQATLDEQSKQLSVQKSALDEKTAQLKSQQAQIDNIIGVKADVIAALKQEFSANNMNVDIDSQTGAMMLDSNVMFDYNEAVLTEEGMDALNQVLPIYCQVLMKEEYKDYLAEIIIDGYTDTSGEYAYNLDLSQKRSLAVAQYLLSIQEEFLSEAQIEDLKQVLTVNGHSMAKPILDENGNVDMDASRRVEVKFRLKDEEMIQELTKIMSGAETEKETEKNS